MRNLLIRAIVAAFFVLGVASMLVDWNAIEDLSATRTTNDAAVQGDIVRLSAQVSGYLSVVSVKDYQTVHKGDVLMMIADDDYRAREARAVADVAAAESAVAIAEAQIKLQAAQVRVAAATVKLTGADLERAEKERARQEELLPTEAGLRRDWENARAAAQRLQATYAGNERAMAADEAQIEALRATRDQQEAVLAARQAALAIIRIDLGRTRIVAPFDGVVTQRLVRQGQYVAAGTQLITLAPQTPPWIIANYRETQVTPVRVGQAASIMIDAMPGTKWHGHVESIGPTSEARGSLLPPDRSVGNFTKIAQRVPIKITLDQPDGGALRPQLGLSAEVTIDTATAGQSKGAP